MKRTFALAAIIIIFMSAVAAPAQEKKDEKLSKAEQEVRAANQLWADAIARGDMEALDRLFADDLIVTTGNGTIRDKAAEMKDLNPTADLKTYFFNVEDVRVRVYGDAAVVSGHAKWRINYQGRDIDNERRYTSMFVKQRGAWRIVAQQLTRIARQ